MRLPSSILLTCLCLSAATTARAQAPLRAYVAAEVPVAAEAVRAGLARDLGRPVELVDAATAELAIRMAGGEAELRYDADGGARTRAVTLPTDRDDATATLVLIAANLVRDPTEQLVAPAATPTPPAPVAGPPPLAAPPIATGEKPAPANLALARPFQLGLGILGGAASTASGVQGYWYLGMDILGTIAPGVRLGVTRLSVGLGFSNVESFIFSLQGTPTLELFAFVDPRVQVYGQVGVALQGRAQTAVREGLFQVAGFLGGGVRFWLTDWFTLGAQIGLHVVATDAFLMGDVALPQGSVAGSAGLTVGFHIAP